MLVVSLIVILLALHGSYGSCNKPSVEFPEVSTYHQAIIISQLTVLNACMCGMLTNRLWHSFHNNTLKY